MLKKKVQIDQKPIEHDIHLKYRCPTCDQYHWLSFKEAKTKNFKVVCYCDTVFKVKRVSDFKIEYEQEKIFENNLFETEKVKDDIVVPVVINIPKIPLDLLDKACKLFISYGFTQKESVALLKSSYEKNPVDDYSTLVKNTLELLRDNDGIQAS